MINLVEGLNCSGKSTFIKAYKPEIEELVGTPYLNPRRWGHEDFLSLKFQPQASQDYFLLGAYTALMEELCGQCGGSLSKSFWWDRTWISAYVYGSLSWNTFKAIAQYMRKTDIDMCTQVYYMDTPIEVCKERYLAQHPTQDRNYVYPMTEWEDIDKNFRETLDHLETDYGITTHYVTCANIDSYIIKSTSQKWTL